MSKFFQLYNDPRWHKRREEIKELHNFHCEECDSEKRLQVHHNWYHKGRAPWEYDDEELSCLCALCHTKRTLADDQFKQVLSLICNKDSVYGYIVGTLLYGEVLDSAIVENYSVAEGIGHAWTTSHYIKAEAIIHLMDERSHSITKDVLRSLEKETRRLDCSMEAAWSLKPEEVAK